MVLECVRSHITVINKNKKVFNTCLNAYLLRLFFRMNRDTWLSTLIEEFWTKEFYDVITDLLRLYALMFLCGRVASFHKTAAKF